MQKGVITMKRIIPYLLTMVVCMSTCFAGLGDADDGYLTSGEYDYDVQLENYDFTGNYSIRTNCTSSKALRHISIFR